MLILQAGNAAETQAVAFRLALLLKPGDLLTLSGDLGAGKTTFVQGLARGLGSKAQVTSPTFTLFQEYTDGRLPLIHGDAYRLNSSDQLQATGFDDYLQSGAVIALEWPENVPGGLPAERLEIRLEEDSGRECPSYHACRARRTVGKSLGGLDVSLDADFSR